MCRTNLHYVGETKKKKKRESFTPCTLKAGTTDFSVESENNDFSFFKV